MLASLSTQDVTAWLLAISSCAYAISTIAANRAMRRAREAQEQSEKNRVLCDIPHTTSTRLSGIKIASGG
jgi:copper oxidase (laccase) domain-containing protein